MNSSKSRKRQNQKRVNKNQRKKIEDDEDNEVVSGGEEEELKSQLASNTAGQDEILNGNHEQALDDLNVLDNQFSSTNSENEMIDMLSANLKEDNSDSSSGNEAASSNHQQQQVGGASILDPTCGAVGSYFSKSNGEFNYRNMVLESYYQKNLYNTNQEEKPTDTTGLDFDLGQLVNSALSSSSLNKKSPSHHNQDNLLALMNKLNNELANERENSKKLREMLKASLYEKNEVFVLLKKCQAERDQMGCELTTQVQIRDKEYRKLKSQLDHFRGEYQLVMSERDMVHKEIEALQEKLIKTESQLKQLTTSGGGGGGGSTSSAAFNTSRMSELNTRFSATMNNSILNEMDKLNETLEELEIDSLKNQLKLVSKQRDEALIKIDELYCKLRSYPEISFKEITPASLASPSGVSQQPGGNIKFVEENEQLKSELTGVIKELNLAKKRRDWAFIERDKILRERESIRSLCDELRHQRDKSISELAESLRESDELKKQKAMAIKQIQMLEEKLNYYEEKFMILREKEEAEAAAAAQAAAEQANDSNKPDEENKESLAEMNNSKMIPNFNDLNTSNHRLVKIEFKVDEEAYLGVEFAYATYTIERENSKENIAEHTDNKSKTESEPNGLDDNEDAKHDMNIIVVNSVDKDSTAYGKLKVNDRVVKINDVDLKSIESDAFQELITNLKGSCVFIVSRYFDKPGSNRQVNRSINSIETYSNIPSISSSASSTSSSSSLNKNAATSTKPSSFSFKSSSNTNTASQNGFPTESKQLTARSNQSGISNGHIDYVGEYLRNKSAKSSTAATQQRLPANAYLISVSLDGLNSLILETGVFIAGLKQIHPSRVAGLCVGDRILSINGVSLTNKSTSNLTAKFIHTFDKFQMVVQKMIVPQQASETSPHMPTNSSYRFSNGHDYYLTYENDKPMLPNNFRSVQSSRRSSKNSLFSEVLNQLGGTSNKSNGNYKSSPRYHPTAAGKTAHEDEEKLSNGAHQDLIKNFQEYSRKEKHLFFENSPPKGGWNSASQKHPGEYEENDEEVEEEYVTSNVKARKSMDSQPRPDRNAKVYI